MTDTTTPGAHSAIRVLAALAELGEATTAAIADQAGLAYSTTTSKLRAWEDTGQAERFRTDDGRTLWRLTAAGRAATASPDDRPGPADVPSAQAAPAAEPDTTPTTTSDDDAQPADVLKPDSVVDPDPVTTPDRADEPAAVAGPDTDTTDGVTTRVEAVTAIKDDPDDIGTSVDAAAVPNAVAADAGSAPDSNATPVAAHGQPGADIPTARGDSSPLADSTDLPAGTVDLPAATVDLPAGTVDQAESAPAPAPAGTGEQSDSSDQDRTTPARRSAGSMRAAILDICTAQPDRQFKVAELCRLIDAANTGADARKASPGAVYNAATKLAAAGTLTQTLDRPATFQLSRTGD